MNVELLHIQSMKEQLERRDPTNAWQLNTLPGLSIRYLRNPFVIKEVGGEGDTSMVG